MMLATGWFHGRISHTAASCTLVEIALLGGRRTQRVPSGGELSPPGRGGWRLLLPWGWWGAGAGTVIGHDLRAETTDRHWLIMRSTISPDAAAAKPSAISIIHHRRFG